MNTLPGPLPTLYTVMVDSMGNGNAGEVSVVFLDGEKGALLGGSLGMR